MIRKTAVLIGIPLLLVLIIAGAYSTARNFKAVQANEGLKQQSAALQDEISAVEVNLLDVEAAQRGYLLTGDSSYLQRYEDATKQLPVHFSTLRSELAARPDDERASESQLEALAEAKLAEAQETIHLRQQGYRHRAFGIIDSNRGKQLMDDARLRVSALAAAEVARSSEYIQQTGSNIDRAVKETIGSTALLLGLTGLVFGVLWVHSRSLEAEIARNKELIRAKSAQLEAVTITVSQQLPELLRQVRDSARDFLNRFVDYLPAIGQTQAAEMMEMAEKSNRLITDSVKRSASTAA
ncbi:MAG: CHASE3 domain-containing protein [Terriglobales bacterium]